MNDFSGMSVADYLTTVRNYILNRAVCGAAFRKSWGDEFAMDQNVEAWTDTDPQPFGRRITIVELIEVPDDVLQGLGFGSWDGALRLVPLWAYNYLADGETLTSINGDAKTKGADEIDLDVRFGAIAWGFSKPGAVAASDEAEA